MHMNIRTKLLLVLLIICCILVGTNIKTFIKLQDNQTYYNAYLSSSIEKLSVAINEEEETAIYESIISIYVLSKFSDNHSIEKIGEFLYNRSLDNKIYSLNLNEKKELTLILETLAENISTNNNDSYYELTTNLIDIFI